MTKVFCDLCGKEMQEIFTIHCKDICADCIQLVVRGANQIKNPIDSSSLGVPMTPERLAEIRNPCPWHAIDACPCHDEKEELIDEIDRLRDLIQAANQTIHELGQVIEEETGDVPDAVRDWKRMEKA